MKKTNTRRISNIHRDFHYADNSRGIGKLKNRLLPLGQVCETQPIRRWNGPAQDPASAAAAWQRSHKRPRSSHGPVAKGMAKEACLGRDFSVAIGVGETTQFRGSRRMRVSLSAAYGGELQKWGYLKKSRILGAVWEDHTITIESRMILILNEIGSVPASLTIFEPDRNSI